jgi:glycosyltransferase involved in cell wall biosynthesis
MLARKGESTRHQAFATPKVPDVGESEHNRLHLEQAHDSRPFVVVNTSHPEMNQLAAELASRDLLAQFVRPYTSKDRAWERALRKSVLSAHDLSRRAMPPDLPVDLVTEAALIPDFFGMLLNRSSRRFPGKVNLQQTLVALRSFSIGRSGARHARDSRITVANIGGALGPIRAVHSTGGKAILNYPIAHHRYAKRLLGEEAELQPAFAGTLQFHKYSKKREQTLDAECQEADLILLGSSFSHRSFLTEGFANEALAVVPYGVDLEMFRSTAASAPGAETRFSVLFVGQIGQRKGISYLLEGYDAFKKSDTELLLVGAFVGDPSVFTDFESLFRHIPFVPRPLLSELYRDASVLVLPTLIEGMPLVVLEAMASGCPVIVTDHGPGDIVRDGIDGFVIPIRSSDAIRSRLELLYQDRELRRTMGRAAAERAATYTWQAYRKNMLQVLSTFQAENSSLD